MAVLHPQPHYQQSRQRSSVLRNRMGLTATHAPLRLGLSYAIDWIVIVGIAAVGAAFWQKSPNRRPFSPFDPSISFPYVEHEKISTVVLAIVSVLIPAVLTAIIALALTPAANRSISWRGGGNTWRRKIWEWNVAWMGLGLSLAVTLLFTEGLKDIMGKPRPDLLARCILNPDDQVQNDVVGGGIAQGVLVSWTSCLQPDAEILADGFQSFPSGHSSFSWCGMFYLTLYLCSKFSIAIPYLLPHTYSPEHANQDVTSPIDGPTYKHNNSAASSRQRHIIPQRHQTAAPPAYLFILALVPVSVATYVASSRYSDFRHHGFDIIFGSLMGIFFSWGGFRMYHLPIRRGAGWAWGPRSAERAWGIGVGTGNYVGSPVDANDGESKDVEMGNMAGDDDDAETRSNGKVLDGAGDGTMGTEHFSTRPTRSLAGPSLSDVPLQSRGLASESRL